MSDETPISDEALLNILRLTEEASPAPWTSARLAHAYTGESLTAGEFGEYMSHSHRVSQLKDAYFVYVELDDGPADVCHTGNGPRSAWNAALIAAMRNDLPGILVRLERAEAQIEGDRDIQRAALAERDQELLRAAERIAERESQLVIMRSRLEECLVTYPERFDAESLGPVIFRSELLSILERYDIHRAARIAELEAGNDGLEAEIEDR